MNGQSKFFSLVSEHGGTEVRCKNHRVFRFPSGIQFVVSKTPSDHRSWENAHSKLRQALGLTTRVAHVGKRRLKRIRKSQARHLRDSGSQVQPCSFEELMKAHGVKPAKWRHGVEN